MKKVMLLVLVALLATSLMAAFGTRLVRLTVINKGSDTVYLKLNGVDEGGFYYLTIPGGEEKVFTLVQDLYVGKQYFCGASWSTSLDLSSQVRLVYRGSCSGGDVANFGEPTMEKVSFYETANQEWRYQY
ncbi:hypothetical protein B5M50_06905 [candidate division KSB1 bacterium 4484_219]|nr:MAG: hypothetical protein B5M50_06905 [candidate division KSB1 bacterium 4484_219]